MKNLLFVAILAFAAAGCNYSYQKTDTGLLYNIIKNGSGEKVQPGLYLKVNYKAMFGDSVLFSSYEGLPVFGQYDTNYIHSHDFIDIMGKMRVGDSAVYVRFIDTLQKRGFIEYNEIFKPGGKIDGMVTILASYPTKGAMDSAYMQAMNDIKVQQIAALEKMLKDKNITNYKKTQNGVFVVIDQPGTGLQIQPGSKVSMKYTGALKNGNKFDSNVDTAFGHTDPFEFTIGQGAVIEGWDEGLLLFKQGDKGKLYIPSMMGYGPQAQGDKIPAFSDLIFDVEVLSVTPPIAPVVGPAQQ